MKTGHLYLYGVIGQPDIFDPGPGVTLKMITESALAQGKVDDWQVHIHSDGGDYAEGMAIHDFLTALPEPVTTINEGKCYSIASVILLAGDKRIGRPNCDTLIHNPWGNAEGDADKVLKYGERLREIETTLQSFYANATSTGEATIAKMMKQTTGMTAKQALELGFLTEIKDNLKAVAFFDSKNEKPKMVNLKNLLSSALAQLGITPVKNLSLTLSDNTGIYIETDADKPAVGNTVRIGSADGPLAPDGDHTLSDGTVITTAGGKITKISEPSNDDDMDAKALETLNESIKALTESNKALTDKVTGFENKFTGIEAEIKNLKDGQDEIKNLAKTAEADKKENADILASVKKIGETITSTYTPERINALQKLIDNDPAAGKPKRDGSALKAEADRLRKVNSGAKETAAV